MNELFRRILDLPEQSSTMARSIDTLHYVVIGISTIGAIGVAAFIAIMLIRFRASRRGPRGQKVPAVVEIGAIAGLLAMFYAFWIVGFRQYVQLETPPDGAMDVYVIAKQWMWEFAYPDGNATTDDLYVPAGRPVRLVMTSRDVIHSFYVPEFRIKQDVVPGRSTTTWFEASHPGTFQILCAEYCGLQHSMMRGRVIALDAADYARWSEAQPAHGPDLATAGEKIAAEHGCLRCHTVDGTSHLGPTFAGLYGSTIPLADSTVVVADEAYLTESMMDPERKLHAGFPPIMPTYRGLLAGPEIAAIVEFIRSLPARPPGSPLPVAPLPPAPIPTMRSQ